MVAPDFWTRHPSVQRVCANAQSGKVPFPPVHSSAETTPEDMVLRVLPGKADAAILSAYLCRQATEEGRGAQAIEHEQAMHAHLREFQAALASFITELV